jgi:uncharacterized membrane protein YphA (DoxX/SURF4 family)
MEFAPATAALTAFIGILFIYSGLAKLFALRRFADALSLLPRMPRPLAPYLAISIPTLEFVAGAGALWGFLWAKVLIVAMLLAFCVIAGQVRASGQRVRCNCFGSQESEYLSGRTILRNCSFMALTFVSASSESTPPTILSCIYGAVFLCLFLAITAAIHNQSRAIALRDAMPP